MLRTNTSSVSQPPPSTTLLAAQAVPDGVAVGATADLTADGGYSFLQIVQQATVTNAAGYYLRYLDTNGQSLPAGLFVKGVGQITLLIRYTANQTNAPGAPLAVQAYHNGVVLAQTQPSLVYYAETTDPALEVRYLATAAGTFGVTLSRPDSVHRPRRDRQRRRTGEAGRGRADPSRRCHRGTARVWNDAGGRIPRRTRCDGRRARRAQCALQPRHLSGRSKRRLHRQQFVGADPAAARDRRGNVRQLPDHRAAL